MQFSFSSHFSVSPAQLLSVFTSELLMEKRAKKLNIADYSYETRRQSNSVYSVGKIQIPATAVPTQLRTVVPTGIAICTETNFSATTNGYSTNADITITKVPAQIDLTIQINALADNSSELAYTGNIEVNVPFFGKNIEKQVVAQLPQVFSEDNFLIQELLAKLEKSD